MEQHSSTTAPDKGDVWHDSLSSHRMRQSERIAHVAMEIIASSGFASLSMSALADAAGVSRQTLYKYFADVDAVLAALAAMGNAGIVELAQRTAAEAEPREGLRVFVEAVLAASAVGHASPAALMAALPPAARERIRDHESEAEGLVVALLRRGREDGSFRPDLDPDLDGRIVYRAILAAHDLAAEPDADVAQLTGHVSAAVLRIVEAGPRAGSQADRIRPRHTSRHAHRR